MRRPRLPVMLWVLLLAALATAPPAAALAPGVTVDPNSPSGKEYAVPLPALRAQGNGSAPTVDGAAQPRFGVGITPAAGTGTSTASPRRPATATAGAHGATASHHRGPVASRTRPSTGGSQPRSGAPVVDQAQLTALTRPGSAVPAVALIVVLALALGLGAGWGISRLARR